MAHNHYVEIELTTREGEKLHYRVDVSSLHSRMHIENRLSWMKDDGEIREYKVTDSAGPVDSHIFLDVTLPKITRKAQRASAT